MTDAAYEHEIDEWEIMYANEIEATNEELRAEQRQAKESQQQPRQTGITQSIRNNDNVVEKPEDNLQKAQRRLDQVLERCAKLLNEEAYAEVATENAPTRFKHVVRKKTQSAGSNIDRSTAEYFCSRPSIDVDSLPVVLNDGKRLFIRKKQPNSLNVTSSSIRSVAASIVNIEAMMKAVDQMEIEEVMKRDKEMMLLARNIPATEDASNMLNAVLWLDKYRPQSFLDLLSDERTNREVLTWIKSWDRYVFPKKGFAGSAPPASSPGASLGSLNASLWSRTTPLTNANQSSEAEDVEDKRPEVKIILISGPPGSGKTTLANIVARHAGYNPIEVNASDDRTANVLRDKIISAMEMQSIWSERKPNCIILDEIDGAMNGTDGKSAVEAICEVAKAPLRKKKAGNKTVAIKSHPLTRPIICICNDLYASVLRPLRQLTKIFVLDAPHQQRLVTRLKHICRLEGINASTSSLSTLCSNAGNDIRYCLNALQFRSTQSLQESLPVITSSVALKDHVHSMFEALDIVFYEQRSKYVKGELAAAEKITDAVASLGNLPLLLNGLDENVPKMIFNDPTMSKICGVFEWLGLADEYENRARGEQQYAFQSYIPFAAIAAHAACCTSSKRRIEYPRIQSEAQRRSYRSQNILMTLTQGAQLQPILRHGTSVLVLDVVPWVLASLSPRIRRINPALQTEEEKTMIERLIECMASLGLSFRRKYLPDGTEDYALEPPLSELVEFRGHKGSTAFETLLPLTLRKMIARELELEQMRRNVISVSSKKPNDRIKTLDATVDKSVKANIEEKVAKTPTVLPEFTPAEQVKKVDVLRKRNPFAFAHREAKRRRHEELKAKGNQQHPNNSTRENAMVRFKFNEGYTCGIKTAVYVRDLL